MTAEELLDRYAAGERDFSGVDLGCTSRLGSIFRGSDLRDAVLDGAISAADFTRANLQGAIDFFPQKTDILNQTIMSDGSLSE